MFSVGQYIKRYLNVKFNQLLGMHLLIDMNQKKQEFNVHFYKKNGFV